jgi:sigma-E factor negative regulatory protein RseA
MKKASLPTAARPECELLSSLMDGETSAEETRALLAVLCGDDELRSRWVAFHVVGDALRSHEVAASHSAAFCARVARSLAKEPPLLTPRTTERGQVTLRRFLAPGLAIAASVAALGFVAVPLLRTPAAPGVQQAATEPSPVTLPAEGTRRAAVTVANARSLQAYLAAHRELTTGAALPRATPYLRTSPAEQPEGR